MITVTFTDGTTTHTVHTEGEVLDLVKRYFSKVKVGDCVRILTDGGYIGGKEHIGEIHDVKKVYPGGVVEVHCSMSGQRMYWAYKPEEYELVKE